MRYHPIAITLLAFAALSAQSRATNVEIWVAPNGNDSNPGTRVSPLATLAGAQKAVRQHVAAGLDGDVNVTIRGGTYQLPESLVFGPQDSGTEKFAITYRAAPGGEVVVSGGSRITGWTSGPDRVWTAKVPGVKEGKWYFRHLFVDSRRATRARTPNADASGISGLTITSASRRRCSSPARRQSPKPGLSRHIVNCWGWSPEASEFQKVRRMVAYALPPRWIKPGH